MNKHESEAEIAALRLTDLDLQRFCRCSLLLGLSKEDVECLQMAVCIGYLG